MAGVVATPVEQEQDTKHFVVLLRWDVRTYWKEVAGKKEGLPAYPYAYGFNHRWFPARVAECPVLWVIASPDYGEKKQYRLPPTLIARLQVKCLRRGKKRRKSPKSVEDYDWVAVADQDTTPATEGLPPSVYLPVNNAFAPVTESSFLNRFGKKTRVPSAAAPPRTNNPYSHIPTHFRGPRRIDPDHVDRFQTHARRVYEGRTVFLSYNHEHRDYVKKLLRELDSRDFAPWIDFALIPKTARSARYERKQLTDMLEDGVRQAGVFVAVVGHRYFDSKWTQKELKAAGGSSVVVANLLVDANASQYPQLSSSGAKVVSGLRAAQFADLVEACWREHR